MTSEHLDETGNQRLAYARERETVLAMQLRMKVAGWKDDTFASVAETRNWSEDADPDSELWRFRA